MGKPRGSSGATAGTGPGVAEGVGGGDGVNVAMGREVADGDAEGTTVAARSARPQAVAPKATRRTTPIAELLFILSTVLLRKHSARQRGGKPRRLAKMRETANRRTAFRADNISVMNGFHVGAAVAIGIEIGATIVSPELELSQVLMLMVFIGAVIGFVFHLYKMAFSGTRLPFGRP